MSIVQFSTADLLGVAKSFSGAPLILAELTRLTGDPDTRMDQVAALLRRDAPLAARLIRIANSVSLAQSEPVSSVEAACHLIGMSDIHRIVGIMAVEGMGAERVEAYRLEMERLRKNAILVALLMEEMAEEAGEDPPTAYAIGLLRPIGMLTLDKLATRSGRGEAFDSVIQPDVGAWEKDTFGITSPEATALILEAWRFPVAIPRAIRDHRQPKGKYHCFIHLLHIAARTADKVGYGLPCEIPYWTESEEIYRKAGFDPRDTKRHTAKAFVAFDRLCSAMG
jgi:HD-like signal output (HDOD) protein